MDRFTNVNNIDLSAAVWLCVDDYDYVTKPNYISVTTLIKPIRQIILPRRIPAEEQVKTDVLDRFASVLGQTLHTGVEVAWKEHYRTSMEKLGYPKRVIDAVRINPEKEEPDTIPVYTEVRSEREIDGFIVGGKVDLIIERRLRDVKKTSVFKYQSQSGVGNWRLQGSLYRWLNQEKIHHDELLVQYLLLDWNRGAATRDANYPNHPLPHRLIQLMDPRETEQWVRDKLRLLVQYADAPDDQLPDCSEEDLWRSSPVHKFYANPEKTNGRSTKNFETLSDALQHKSDKGGKGVVITKPGEVRACGYCPSAPICGQRLRLIADGSIPTREP